MPSSVCITQEDKNIELMCQRKTVDNENQITSSLYRKTKLYGIMIMIKFYITKPYIDSRKEQVLIHNFDRYIVSTEYINFGTR